MQQQIGALQKYNKHQRFANVALVGIIVLGGFIAAVFPAGDEAFGIITCKGWIIAATDAQ